MPQPMTDEELDAVIPSGDQRKRKPPMSDAELDAAFPSVTGDFGPMRRYPEATFPSGDEPAGAVFSMPLTTPTHEQQAEQRRLGIMSALAQIQPEAERRYQASDDPIGPRLDTGSRVAVDFLKHFVGGGMRKAGQLGQLTGIGGESANTLADPSYLQTLSENNPPQSPLESAGRGGAAVGGFVGSIWTDPAKFLAGPGSRLVGGTGSGLGAWTGRLSGGLSGYMLPGEALGAATGEQSWEQAAGHTLGAGPRFIADAPGMAYRSATAIGEGNYARAGDEAAPLVLMGLGKMGRKKGVSNEGQKPAEAERQGQVQEGLLKSQPDATDPRAIPREVQRFEEAGVPPSSVDKPHGLYTTPSSVTSPHAELGGERSTMRVNPKANVFQPENIELIASDRGRGSRVGASAGHSALRALAGEAEFNRLTKMGKSELSAELKAKYPGVEWSKYYDGHEMLEALGGKMARDAGYDAIWVPDKTSPEFSEFVGLTKGAFGGSAEPASTTPAAARESAAPEPAKVPNDPRELWQIPRNEYLESRRRAGNVNLEFRLQRMNESGKPGISDETIPNSSERLAVFRDKDGKTAGYVAYNWNESAKETWGETLYKESGKIDPKETVEVWVRPDMRRTGVATRLYDHLRSQGVNVDFLSGVVTSPEGASFAHKRAVRQAIKSGKSVPPEVLSGYPELTQATAETRTAAPETAHRPTFAPFSGIAKIDGKEYLAKWIETDQQTTESLIAYRNSNGALVKTWVRPDAFEPVSAGTPIPNNLITQFSQPASPKTTTQPPPPSANSAASPEALPTTPAPMGQTPNTLSNSAIALPPEQKRTAIPDKIQGTPPPLETGQARLDRQPIPTEPPERRFLGFLRGDVELPKKIGNIGPEMYAQDMTGVVERQGGPYGRAIANRSREAVDLADRIEGGQQNRILDAEQIIRRSPRRVVGMDKPEEATAAYNELAEPRWNENVPSAGFSGLMDAVEYGGPLGQRAQAFADRYNNVVRRNFRIGQSLGTSMRTLRGDLVNLGGKTQNKFIRVYTPDAYQIYQHKGKVYREFVDTISKLNGIKIEKAEQAMKEIFDPPIERTVAIEKARAIKIMPTHFKASDGRVYQIMEADPIKALRGAVRNMADKIALNNRFGPGTSQTDISPSTRKSLVELRGQFAAGKGVPEKVFNRVVGEIKKAYQADNEAIGKKWGEAAFERFKKSGGKEADFETLKNMVQGGLQGRGNRIQQLRAKFADAGGDPYAYDNLIRTLSNRPVGTPDSSRSSGGKFKDAFKRVASGLEGTYRSLLLTGAAPAQIFETLGATAPMVGIRASMKAMARLSSPQRIEAEREILRRMGAITTEQMNIRLTEGSKIEDYFRLQNKLIRTISGFDPVNEANETVGAAMGRAFSERIRKGNISATDRARLSGMGYEQRQIDRLSTGKASNAEYDAIVRRVAKLQGTTLRRSEQSPMANSPIWRAFAPFQNYFQNTIRQTNRMSSSFMDSIRSGDAKRIAASSRVIAESALGRTLQGAGTLYIISLLAGKDTERGKKVGETPLQYVANNIGTAMWGGTLKSIASFVGDATFGGGVSSENAINKLLSGVSAPYRMLATALDAATGAGRFQGMSESERALELIRSSVPATKTQKAYLAATGMQDPVMESAVSRYWQWFFSKNPSSSKEAKPDNAVFNRKVKNAVIALRNGRTDEASALIDEALASDTKRDMGDVREGFSDKKLLSNLTTEQLAELEKTLGPKHFEAVKRYDALIDNFNWSSQNAGAFFSELANLRRMEKEAKASAKTELELKAKMGDGPYRKLKRFEAVERSLREARSAKDRFGSGHYQDTIDRVLKEQFERQE